MAHFIFSNNEFLAKLAELNKQRIRTSQDLYTRLGVKPVSNEIITMIVVSQNQWEGHHALLLLHEECEKIYKKRVDLTRIRSVVFKDIEAVGKSPHLERARFIIILDEDLLGAENYPELEEILPFIEE